MVLMLITFVLCLSFSLLSIYIFSKLNFVKKNYCGKYVPYAGGVIFLLTISISVEFYYIKGIISYLKLIFLMLSIFCVYLSGFFDDIFSDEENELLDNNFKKHHRKIFSINFIKSLIIVIAAFLLFYSFNDNYWYLKSLITLLFIFLYNCIDTVPGRCLKLHYILLIALNLSYLQWTNELLIISLMASSTYYFFDAFSFAMLGKGGSNILGFTAGLIYSEALGSDVYSHIGSAACILVVILLMRRKSLSQIMSSNSAFNFLDKLLTEREYKNSLAINELKSIESDTVDSAFHSE